MDPMVKQTNPEIKVEPTRLDRPQSANQAKPAAIETPATAKRSTRSGKKRPFLSKIKKLRPKRFGLDDQSNPKRLPRQAKIAASIIVAVFIVGVTAGFVINYLTMPVQIGKIETIMALSSRSTDAPSKSEFKVGEPIMLHFEFSSAPVGKGVQFEVRSSSDDKVIRSGATTILRAAAGDASDGQRYVSIVNTTATKLDTGNYSVKLSLDGRVVATINFQVTP